MPLAKTPSWGYICPRIHCWPPCTCSGLGRDTAAWAETADERWDWNILMSVLHTRKLRIRVTWFNKSNRARNRTSVCFATAKSLQSCLTLCDPIESSPPGCPIPGILQARTLEWVAISFSGLVATNPGVKSRRQETDFLLRWWEEYLCPWEWLTGDGMCWKGWCVCVHCVCVCVYGGAGYKELVSFTTFWNSRKAFLEDRSHCTWEGLWFWDFPKDW